MSFAVRSLAVVFPAAMLFASTTTAEARLFGRLSQAEEPLPPGAVAMPTSAAVNYAPPVAYCGPACPQPCIRYRNAILDCKVRCCDPCKPPIQAVLAVKNPCTCCPVNVPVCLPNCCCGEPTVACHKTLLGAGMVSYSWCCGVTVNVRFDRCGDVLVTYRGT